MSTESVGNVWPLALDLARAYEERGIELVLLSYGRPLTDAQRRAVWGISTLTLHELPLRAEWMDDPWEDVDQVGENLLSLEGRYAPDVVHLHGYAHAALPFRAPVVVSAQASLLAWWEAVHHELAPESFTTYRKRVSAGLRKADAVVAATHSTLDELARHHGAFAHPTLLPVGCDPRRFTPDEKQDLVLSATRSWDGARNLALLIATAERVRWPVLAARDDVRPPAHERASEPSYGHVRGLGRLTRSELADWLGRAAIFAQLGSIDPSGLSVLEAAQAGCALVLGETPSLRELWEGVAVFVDGEDPEEAAAALNELAESAVTRRALARAARERALTRTLAISAAQHLALYEELVSARREQREPRVRP